jgi:hypothetical protein
MFVALPSTLGARRRRFGVKALQGGIQSIPPSESLPPAPGFRDLRIDFIRGLALLIIYIDHIPHNVVSWFTLQRFAFHDCAEVFVFISGYVAGLVFTRTLVRDGLRACCRRAWRRCGQLYLAQTLIAVFTLAVLYAFLERHFLLPERDLYAFVTHPYWAFQYRLLLVEMPYVLGVLPMFMAFIGLAPFLAWALMRRHGVVLFLLLTGVYLTAQCMPDVNLYPYFGPRPSGFNTFAWQLVFALGFLLGNRKARGLPLTQWIRPWHLILAGGTLLAIAVVRVGPTSHLFRQLTHTQLLWQALPTPIPLTGKPTVEPLRIGNLLLMAMVVGCSHPPRWFWEHPMVRSLIVCGQQPLVVFTAGAILTTVASCIVLNSEARWIPVLLSAIGCAVLIATGQAALRLSESVRGNAPDSPNFALNGRWSKCWGSLRSFLFL